MTAAHLPLGRVCPDAAPDVSTGTRIAGNSAQGSQRRRLWQLPTQAHELLLALSFTTETLRREVARTMGRLHKGRCLLRGRDADVLYSAVHALATRNPLSEAMHKQLDAKHAPALRNVTAVKDETALRATWACALAEDSPPAGVPAVLWAVLTHALGETVQSDLLYEARAWAFAHARRSVVLTMAQQQTAAKDQQTRRHAEDLQSRLTAQHRRSAAMLRQAQLEIARLQGEVARLQLGAQATVAPAPVHRRVERPEDGPRARASDPAPDRMSVEATAPAPAAMPSAQLAVAGQRVLCVGGIQHAVARYRGRIEKLGGRFEHHDGGIEDSAHSLDARLGRADVVICQAGCINHEAYHRVKRHCDRTGTPCVYLDRPSLSRLDRALALAKGAEHAPG